MKIYSKLILSTTLCFTATLGNAQTTIGYSNGYANRTEGVRFGTGATQGMAIRISKEKAQQLKGEKINAIRTIFSTSHTKNLKFFISKQLGGEPEYTQDIAKSSTRWKTYDLTTPYTITGEEFYLGYTCEVTEIYKPHLFDHSQDFGNQLIWAINNDQWQDISNKGLGAANLLFIVDGGKKFTDVTMKQVDANGFYKAGKGYVFGGQIYNFGTEPIESFDLTCQIGESAPSTYSVKDAAIAQGESYDFKMPEYFPTVNGKVPFKVAISNINGSEDADQSDNLSMTSTYIYPENVEKKVLVEGFTGQACGNCPKGHTVLNKALEGIEEKFVEVSHHAGYQIDAFTMKDDMEYTWFYNNNGSTYAPASMFDRTMVTEGTGSVVFETQDVVTLNEAIRKSQNAEPFIAVKLSNEYDKATRKNQITVQVHTYVVPSEKEHRLNLFLTQNNIVSYQSGAGSNYVHNHVFRGALNGTWGEKIDLVEGETVTKTYEYTLPEEIVSTQSNAKIQAIPEDMHLVAFVSDAAETALDCKVYNTASVKMVNDDVTGIGDVVREQPSQVVVNGHQVQVSGTYTTAVVYNSLGQQVATLQGTENVTLGKGFYVVSVQQADGQRTAQKVYIAN